MWGTMNYNSLKAIQENMASRLSSEMRMNQTVELLSLLQSLHTDKMGRIQKELIYVEASYAGLGDVHELLDELLREGNLKEQGEYILFA